MLCTAEQHQVAKQQKAPDKATAAAAAPKKEGSGTSSGSGDKSRTSSGYNDDSGMGEKPAKKRARSLEKSLYKSEEEIFMKSPVGYMFMHKLKDFLATASM